MGEAPDARVLTVATLLWDANDKSLKTSRCYDESWADKLYRGFSRNLTRPFRMVCHSERLRVFDEPIECIPTLPERPGYGDCVRPYELNAPMILVGLDTIITGNVDHLAAYCMSADTIALPRDPYHKARACNGVALVPAGKRSVWDSWSGANDMEHMRAQPHAFLDDLFPGEVVSFKGEARDGGLGSARVVYFHGAEKPHEPGMPSWVRDNWL